MVTSKQGLLIDLWWGSDVIKNNLKKRLISEMNADTEVKSIGLYCWQYKAFTAGNVVNKT